MLEKVVKKEDFRVLIAYPNYTKMLTPSSAVGLFTALLKKEGYNVDLFDCTPYSDSYSNQHTPSGYTDASGKKLPNAAVLTNRLLANKPFPLDFFNDVKTGLLNDFAKKIEDYRPHAVIFSTVVEDTLPQAQEMMGVVSQYGIDTLLGGVATTMAPQMAMDDKNIKLIGIGEGEETILEFCERVRTRASLENILGTWARDSEGNVVKNSYRPVRELDLNPPADYSLFDKNRFSRPLGYVDGKTKMWNRAMPIETFRGCVYTCTFCNSPAQARMAKERGQGKYPRKKSMDVVENEIVTLMEENDGDFLYINDDAFLARSMEEIDSIIEMKKRADERLGKTIPFWMQTRFEDIRSEKQLERLKEVGLYRISFGLEHGNEEFRKKKLLRNISNKEMIEKSKIVQRVGVPYSVNVIIGMPYETRELVFETIALNRELGGFDSIAPNVFTPYRGTPLRDMALKEGWLDPDARTDSFVGGSLLRMPAEKGYLQEHEILRLQQTYRMYVEFPKERWPEIERAEMALGTDEGQALWEKLKIELFEKKWGMTEEERKLTYSG